MDGDELLNVGEGEPQGGEELEHSEEAQVQPPQEESGEELQAENAEGELEADLQATEDGTYKANDVKAWIGRYEKRRAEEYKKELQTYGSQIVGQVQYLLQQQQQQQPQAAQPQEQAEDFDPYNPSAIQKVVTSTIQNMTTQQQQMAQQIANNVQYFVTNDNTVQDADLKKEILDEAMKAQWNPQIDAQSNAAWIVTNAKNNVLLRKLNNGAEKKTPYDGKTPTKKPLGTVSPGVNGKQRAKPVKLDSDLTKQMAARWGYNDEQLAEILKD